MINIADERQFVSTIAGWETPTGGFVGALKTQEPTTSVSSGSTSATATDQTIFSNIMP